MKRCILGSLAALSMILFTASAYADSVIQVWTCKLHDGKTVDEVEKVSSAWLKAAKSMEGGEDLEVSLEFPLAANTGNGSFNFVLVAADAKTWGVFNNDYDDSPAAEVDDAWFEVASCSSSSLWQSVDIE